MLYPITEIFRSFQGEGHFIGYPMTFVRLSGCSVQDCRIRKECDEAPWGPGRKLRTGDIVQNCLVKARTGIVCITGGEPTDHDLLPLVCELREAGYRVHLETSGVRSVEGMPLDWLTVSPKTEGYAQRMGHTLKVVVRPEWADPWSIIKSIDGDTQFFHRYLQPLTIGDRAVNLKQVIDLLSDAHNGGGRWALSTQAHYGWGVL